MNPYISTAMCFAATFMLIAGSGCGGGPGATLSTSDRGGLPDESLSRDSGRPLHDDGTGSDALADVVPDSIADPGHDLGHDPGRDLLDVSGLADVDSGPADSMTRADPGPAPRPDLGSSDRPDTGPDPPLPFVAPFLWQPVRFDDAVDMGARPGMVDPAKKRASGPILLRDATMDAGLEGVRSGGNTHGVGLAFTDLDGDGWPDIFLGNGTSNVTGEHFSSRLYLNDGAGHFADASDGLPSVIADADVYSVAAGDYDQDGDVDLYLGAQPRDILLRNRKDGTFEDVTAAAGAGGPASNAALVADGRSKIVSFGDLDGDGLLDVVSASSTLPPPGAYLLHGLPGGLFEDVTVASGVRIAMSGNPCAVLWSDFDNDADPDLWIWNDRGGHVLLVNDGSGGLHDVATIAGLNTEALQRVRNPMGIDAADIDHDGDLDIYISGIGNNPLLRNNADGTFTDITVEAGTAGEFGWGLGFEDFDGDTYADIFVAQEDTRDYLVFHNPGAKGGRFALRRFRHAPIRNQQAAHNVAVAFADYDRDGRVDVLSAGTDGSRVNLFANATDTGSHRFLEVVVDRAPGTGASGGVGARVAVKTRDLVQFADILGGSSRASTNSLGVRFGLGDVTAADWVAIQWRDGRQMVFTRVPPGRLVAKAEPMVSAGKGGN